MLCIYNKSINPYFNLASEEYVLKNFTEDCFMLWQNASSVIVGKHQNTLSEINPEFVKKNNIAVVRRLSGGGAVFHDLGNLNFTFITNAGENKKIDFIKFTSPIIEVLQKLSIEAYFSGRNDILIDGKKISGNAEHLYKNKVLHHGTLLFSSVISDISQALNVNNNKYIDKSVKSVSSRVTNICEHLKKPLSINEFIEMIFSHINNNHKECRNYDFNKNDIQKINELVEKKYSTFDWNYGYSPKYNFSKSIHTQGGNLDFFINVDKGIITNIKIFGDFFNKHDITELEKLLTDIPHNEDIISKKIENIDFSDYFVNISKEEFVKGMF